MDDEYHYVFIGPDLFKELSRPLSAEDVWSWESPFPEDSAATAIWAKSMAANKGMPDMPAMETSLHSYAGFQFTEERD